MRNITSIFKIKNQSGVKLMISMLFISILFASTVWRSITGEHFTRGGIHSFFMYIQIVWGVGCVGVLLFTFIRMFQKPFELQLKSDSLVVKGREIKAEEIREIRVQEVREIRVQESYTRVIGIKPKGKKIVSIHLSFRFAENEDKAMRELQMWAASQQVNIVNGTFVKWL